MVIRDWDDTHDYDSQIPPSEWNKMVDSIKRNGVNVKDHGAVGDGNTDDYPAIWDAINYANDNNIKNVYFPAGNVFRIESSIVLNQNRTGLNLISDGATILNGSTDVSRMIRMNPTTSDNAGDINIIGLVIDGNVDNLDYTEAQLTDRPVIGIFTYSTATGWTDNVKIINCEVKNVNGSAVGFGSKSRNCTAVNLWAHHNRTHGFFTSANSWRSMCLGLRSEFNVAHHSDTAGSGFDISGGENVLVDGFICRGNGYGFKFGSSDGYGKVVNGYLLDNNGRGMYTSATVKYMFMDNVTAQGNNDHGFRFGHSGTYRIGRITSIEDSQTGTIGAVYVGNVSLDLTIDELNVFDSHSRGFKSDTSSHITIRQFNVRGSSSRNEIRGPVYILGGYSMDNNGYLVLEGSNSMVKNLTSNDGLRFEGTTHRKAIDCDLSGASTPISGTVDHDVRNII